METPPKPVKPVRYPEQPERVIYDPHAQPVEEWHEPSPPEARSPLTEKPLVGNCFCGGGQNGRQQGG